MEENDLSRFEVFVSYRRDGGSDIARLIKFELEQELYSVFLDVVELKSGRFDERLLQVIEQTPNYVVILSKDSLNNCHNEGDWLRKEIAHALKTKRNIIPVFKDDFEFPPKESLPEDIRDLVGYNGVKYDHYFSEAALSKVTDRLTVTKTKKRALNEEFVLAGDIDSEKMTFEGLLPKHISTLLFKVWPGIMVLQWVLVLFFAFKFGVLFDLEPSKEIAKSDIKLLDSISGNWWEFFKKRIDLQIVDLTDHEWLKKKPLAKDFFFIWWNLLPFILLGLLVKVRRKIQLLLKEIYSLDISSNRDANWLLISKKNNFWARILSNWLTFLIILGIAGYSVFVQFDKLNDLIPKYSLVNDFKEDTTTVSANSVVFRENSIVVYNSKKKRIYDEDITSEFVSAESKDSTEVLNLINKSKRKPIEALGNLYWWDLRVSPVIYVVRAISLGINFVALCYFLVAVVAMIHVVGSVLRRVSLRVDPDHGDRLNGLRSVGELTALFAPFFILLSYNANIALIDHEGQNPEQVLSDKAVIITGCICYFFALFYGLIPARKQVKQFFRRQAFLIRQNRIELRDRVSAMMNETINSNSEIQKVNLLLETIKNFSETEDGFVNRYCWPIKKPWFVLLISIGFLPLIISILTSLLI